MAGRGIFLDIDGPIILVVPNWRFVVSVNNHQRHFYICFKGGISAVAGFHMKLELGPVKRPFQVDPSRFWLDVKIFEIVALKRSSQAVSDGTIVICILI